MPILGNLVEFPLPEVLLLIGARTGRLRLLEVPEFGIMDVDFSNGEVEALHVGQRTFTEVGDLISKLSAVVQAQGGTFEFHLQPVASVARTRALLVNQLVMWLVCYVDEQVAKLRKLTSSGQKYVLASPQPDIWIDPELNLFFLEARQYLTLGMDLEEVSKHLNMDIQVAHKHLTNLRLLGIVQLMDIADTTQLSELHLQERISRKGQEFLRASRATTELQLMTGKLPLAMRS